MPFRRHNHILPQKSPQGNLGALKITVISNLATLNSICFVLTNYNCHFIRRNNYNQVIIRNILLCDDAWY